MRSEKFEKQVQDKLEGLRMAPTPGLWAAIAEQMPPPPQRKKRAAIWWWSGGSLLAAALVWAWLSYQPGKTVVSTSLAPVELTTSETAPQPAESPAQAETLPQSLSTLAAPSQSQAEELVSTTSPIVSQSIDNIPPTEEPKGSIFAVSAEQQHTAILFEEENETLSREWQGLTSLTTQIAGHTPSVTLQANEQVAELPSPGKWSIWTVLQPEMAGRGNPLGLFGPQGSDHSLVEQTQFGIGTNFPSHAYILQYPRQSISAGALVSYRMTYRWSVQAGAILMLSEGGSLKHGDIDPTLLSEGPTRAEDAIRTYDLELSWRQSALEIPVRAHYLVARKGRHSLNALAGISMNRSLSLFRWRGEKTVGGTAQPDLPEGFYTSENQTITTEGEQELLRFRNWHAHLDGRLLYGLQIRPQLGFYVGPSMKYHLRGSYAGLAARDQMRYRLGFELGMRFGGSV